MRSGTGASRPVRVWAGPVLRWGTRALRRTGRRGGPVTVLVTVTDDNAVLLPACLDGLGAQSRRADEIVLVVVGEDDETRRAVVRAVRSSWRVRSTGFPGASPEQARGQAAAQARGDYVLAVDAGDALHAEALAALSGALDGSGSDVAVAGRGEALRAVTLADHPEVLRGAATERLMVRRGSAAHRALVDGPAAGPAAGPVDRWLRAWGPLVAAASFDTVRVPSTVGPRRGTGEAFGSIPVLAPHAAEWARALQETERLLARCASGAVRVLHEWVLRDELPRWLADAERCDDASWGVLSGLAAKRWGAADPALRARMPVEDRVRTWLAAQDRRADLVSYEAARFQEEGFPTRVSGGRVYAELPAPGVPEEVLELSEAETRLQLRLLRHRYDDGVLDLALAAWVPGVDSDGATVRLALLHDGGRDDVPAEVRAEVGDDVEIRRMSGARYHDHAHGRVTARVATDRAPTAVEVRWAAAGVERAGTLPLPGPGARRGDGVAEVTGVALEDDTLVLRLRGAHSPRSSATPHEESREGSGRTAASHGAPTPVRLVGVVALPGTVTGDSGDSEDSGDTWRVPLLHDPWQLGEQAAPVGAYRLEVGGHHGAPTAELAATLPTTLVSETFRARVRSTPAGLEVVLSAPHRDDEVGPVAQQRLQRWYAGADAPLDPRSVYLQSYTGQAATDSPAAIHRVLRRTRPDLRLRWAVADRSVRVPEGGEPVLMHSREWYAALATSAHVVTNIDLERWFAKRPGQRVLQTFHGYPSKTMGLAAWEGKHFTPRRVERLLARTSGTWDLLLTPTPEMDRHYREQYRYDGPIHPYGYPRDDVLVSAEAEAVRADVRRRLGIGSRTAVLYAPTWRDDLATNFRAAPLVSPLDVDEAAERLGPDHVLLLRGHRFHRRRPRRNAGSVLDVTDYPEINDLVLAADAAVLDYSSLRFDFALTGRPMVFLVPDLDRYHGARGFLHDFAESAPGPLLTTTDQVVAALGELPALTAAYAEERARFHARFNAHQDGHAAERVVAAFFGDPTGDEGPGPAAG